MAQTLYVELRDGEQWQDVAGAFLQWCYGQKHVRTDGCHEGEPGGPADGRRYAAISVPDHSRDLVGYLREWAAADGREIG